MREMRPLLLPQIVARRQSLTSSPDSPSTHHMDYVQSCESLHSNATMSSDCSIPNTPSSSMRGHTRYPSSSSSLSSTPPSHDHMDSLSSSVKLPKLTEEPVERDEEFHIIDEPDLPLQCFCDATDCAHQFYSANNSPLLSRRNARDCVDSYFSDDADFTSVPLPKRRRSEDSVAPSFTSRMETRFPSFSRRFNNSRKRSSGTGLSIQTRSPVPSRMPSMTRSTSMQSTFQTSEQNVNELPPTPTKTIAKQLEESVCSSPMDIVSQEVEILDEPIDREQLASTPLLPVLHPMITLRASEASPMQSPLQSPTIADSSNYFGSPTGTPHMHAVASPPLSTKPSISSLSAGRSVVNVSLNDLQSSMHESRPDHWSHKLGHANFTIHPEPYLPESYDVPSCRQLLADWQQARLNFMKHQMKTSEHYGATSKTYKLSELKWAETEALWKLNHASALAKAGVTEEQLAEASPSGHTTLVKLPSLGGKFPNKDDDDIVGPMTQAAPRVENRPVRKGSFAKFFSEIKFPGSFFGRSTVAAR